MFHMTFVLILYFEWLLGPHKGQIFEKIFKSHGSKPVQGMKPVLCLHVPDRNLYINYAFYTSQTRTLVAMAT